MLSVHHGVLLLLLSMTAASPVVADEALRKGEALHQHEPAAWAFHGGGP